MAGKKLTPDQTAQAIALREAGYTISTVAARLNISVSSAQRIFKSHNAVAGATKAAVVEKARDEMINASFGMDKVQSLAASLVLDDLSLTAQIRAKLGLALEELDVQDPTAFRALAASSTALKVSQDVWRRALPLQKLDTALEVDELPELHIKIMSDDDVAVMRSEQRREEAELDGDFDAVADENETLKWLAESRVLRQSRLDDSNDVIET